MLTVAAALVVMSKTGNPAVLKLRTSITDAITPVLTVAASPMDVVSNAGNWVAETINMRSENIALRNQNLQLLQWQSLAKEMEAENASLRALLNVVPQTKRDFVTARVVSDFGGPYMHGALINGGALQGITHDLAVVSEHGLVGRVVEAGEKTSRVLLLNDINSRVPVIAETVREKSILAGKNDGLPSLTYLAANSKITVGERIVTSGDGGIFPSGVPVGVVTAIKDGIVQVQPFVDFSKVEYVSIYSSLYERP